MSSDFLTSFCHWASQEKIELSSEILHEARLSYNFINKIIMFF